MGLKRLAGMTSQVGVAVSAVRLIGESQSMHGQGLQDGAGNMASRWVMVSRGMEVKVPHTNRPWQQNGVWTVVPTTRQDIYT